MDSISKKIGIIIQARTNSTRLKNKVLLPLGDKTVLEQVFERAQCFSQNIVIATTTNQEDIQITTICQEKGISFFRGDSENVLDRFYRTAQKHKFEIIFRLTADNPLVDIDEMKRLYELLLVHQYDYLSNIKSLPLGLGAELFTMKLLEESYLNAQDDYEKEHVTPFMYQKSKAKTKIITDSILDWDKSIRLTLDEEKDYVLLKKIYDELYQSSQIIDNKLLKEFLDINPDLLYINRSVKQKKC